MYEITLTGGISLKMPETLAEITVEQYCEFLYGVLSFAEWQEEAGEPFTAEYQLTRLHKLAQIVQDFCECQGKGLVDVFQLPAGDYLQSLKDTFNLNELADLDFDRTEGTLYTLFANIYKVIGQVETLKGEKDFVFQWKEKTFRVKPGGRDMFTGTALPPNMTVQEAVEVLDLRRKAESLVKKHPPKNVRWELLHKQLAILALQDGEELPEDDLEFEAFVSERARFFLGIDAATALKADFFLLGQLGLLRPTLTVIGFGIPLDPKV